MKRSVRISVNGIERVMEVEPRTTLLEVLREQLALTGAKLGCDIQVCGTCTVLLDGKPVSACSTLAVSACSTLAVDAGGCSVTTIEGLGDGDALDPLQEAFMDFGALQCGYCTSGFILTAKALLAENPHPTEAEIRSYLTGNFCRCGCYHEIVEAVRKVAGQ